MSSGACAPDVGQMGYEGCSAVINDWSSGAYDSAHNRLLIAGGGHHGYFGNEVYALQLDSGPNGQMIRLNDPTPNPDTTPGFGVRTSSSNWMATRFATRTSSSTASARCPPARRSS